MRVVYIEEAHATDEWPVGSKLYNFEQTKRLEQRVALAKMVQDLGLLVPIIVDVPPANVFSEIYSPWPARFYIISPDGKLTVKPKPVGGTYNTGIIWDVLESLVMKGGA